MQAKQLHALCSRLIAAATTLQILCNESFLDADGDDFPASPEFQDKLLAAEHNLYAAMSHGTSILAQPRGFVTRLATNASIVHLAACLKWLGEFQVLPCVPLKGYISMKELAALADAPERLLCRVVRIAATAGFLHEPEPCCVAHTPLSASYTADLSSSDAAVFLAHYVAPSALQMRTVSIQTPNHALGWSTTGGHFMPVQNPSAKVSQICRQWTAYCRNTGAPPSRRPSLSTNNELVEFDLTSLLSQLEWPPDRNFPIVHVCGEYNEMSAALAKFSNDTQIIIQTYGSPNLDAFSAILDDHSDSSRLRVEVQMRYPGTPQLIENAAAYILQPDFSRSEMGSTKLLACELKAHFECLRVNRAALLIVATRLLPEPGSIASHIEAGARLRDYANLLYNNQWALEASELFSLIEEVGDGYGRLVVKTSMQNDAGATVALAVKYEPY